MLTSPDCLRLLLLLKLLELLVCCGGNERFDTPTQEWWVPRVYRAQTCCSTGGAPPTASNMVPVSSRVLNDKLSSVPTPSNRPLSSTYPGLEKLTVYRFCKSKKMDVFSNSLNRMKAKVKVRGLLSKATTANLYVECEIPSGEVVNSRPSQESTFKGIKAIKQLPHLLILIVGVN